jgi:predicted amidohydrolase
MEVILVNSTNFIPAVRKVSLLSSLILFAAALTTASLTPLHAENRVLFQADSFSSADEVSSAGWVQWSPREEISPHFFVSEQPSQGEKGCLGINGGSKSVANGCWRYLVRGVDSGGYYRFESFYFARRVPNPRHQVIAMLDWRDAEDKRVSQPEYVPDCEIVDGWRKVGGTFQAPEGATGARIELFLRFCPQGTVWWDRISLAQVPDPPARMVRVATVNCRPAGNSTAEENIEEFCRVAAEAGKQDCDIVCLGEAMTLIGRWGRNHCDPDVAQAVPGPATRRLGEVAKEHGMYIVACLDERDGPGVYCTAVLIDRQGKVAGKYRKVTIPREELASGVTPGDYFPVFDTDFGRIGMMICFDLQYTRPAQALAYQGAEIIFSPIWGGNETLAAARCIENQVHLVICGYDMKSTIRDPWGNLLAEAEERPGVAVADIDLNKTHPEPFLGNMRNRFFREMRPDIRIPGLD